MLGKISRGCVLALLACPAVALAEPICSMSFLPAGFDGRAMNDAGSNAYAIDSRGHMVGGSTCAGADTPWTGHAFPYRNGTMHDLGSLGGRDSFAYDINDTRQILGKACRGDACMSVRLDPVSAVPEPGSYALLTAGLVLLAGWRKSGRRESLRFSQPGSTER